MLEDNDNNLLLGVHRRIAIFETTTRARAEKRPTEKIMMPIKASESRKANHGGTIHGSVHSSTPCHNRMFPF